jgi:hypothetical protein
MEPRAATTMRMRRYDQVDFFCVRCVIMFKRVHDRTTSHRKWSTTSSNHTRSCAHAC